MYRDGRASKLFSVQYFFLLLLIWRLWLLELYVVVGVAFRGGIVSERTFQLISGGVEFQRRMVDLDWHAGELHFAVGVGSGLEI